MIEVPKIPLSAFNALHFNLRTLILGVVFITPIWLIDIILFSDTFFKTHELYISILMAYCLTLSWITLHSVLVLLMRQFRLVEQYKYIKPQRIVFNGTIQSAIALLILTGLVYLYGTEHLGFKGFVNLLFRMGWYLGTGFLIIGIVNRIVRLLIYSNYKRKKLKSSIPGNNN